MTNKEVLLRLLKEKREATKLERCKFFVPNGKQEEFLQMPAFINLFSAANGVGKSCIGANIVANLLMGPQNKFFTTELYENFKRPSRGRIMSDATVVETKIVPELKKWLPSGSYKTEKGRKTYESKWTITSGPGRGSFFDILTYNQEPSEFEAVEIDWAWADEPCPRELFTPTVRGFRFGGVFFITMTPLKGAGFLFEQLEEIEELNKVVTKRPRRHIVYGDVESNCRIHGIRGILEHHHIEQICAEYDEEEKMARIEGKPMYQEGRVYKRFGDVHIIPVHKVPRDATRYMSIDPADAKATAITWAYVNKYLEVIFYRELAMFKPIPEIVAAILRLENGEKVKTRIMDAYFGKKKYGNTGEVVRQVYSRVARELGSKLNFINGPTGPGSVEAGHELVRQKLFYNIAEPISGDNVPSMFFMDNMSNTIKSMRNYGYKEMGMRARERDGLSTKAKVTEKWKDFPDTVRFIIQNKPRYYKESDLMLDAEMLDPIVASSATGY